MSPIGRPKAAEIGALVDGDVARARPVGRHLVAATHVALRHHRAPVLLQETSRAEDRDKMCSRHSFRDYFPPESVFPTVHLPSLRFDASGFAWKLVRPRTAA